MILRFILIFDINYTFVTYNIKKDKKVKKNDKVEQEIKWDKIKNMKRSKSKKTQKK